MSRFFKSAAFPIIIVIVLAFFASKLISQKDRAEKTDFSQFLTQIEPVLPGISSHYNHHATIDSWPDYQWTKGSYSYWKVGQYTRFAGIEGVQDGNVHFCGEHTSVNFQGYLNGGVETGQRAAGEVIAALS